MNLTLTLTRGPSTDRSTTGILQANGLPLCDTLELPVRDGMPGSAIPPGTYSVVKYASPHFNREMPLLVDVPGRSEIEVHWGNFVSDTRGCILVGVHREIDLIYESSVHFNILWRMMLWAWHGDGKISIEIRPWKSGE